jgi:C4-dicarboxylate-specific signal transduction histidine kinase
MLRTHELDAKPIDLHAIVRESVALIGHAAVAKQVRIDVELLPDRFAIVGDQVLLQQVFVNLIMNAMDAMTATPVERRRVVIQNTSAARTVEISVQDAGTGVPAGLNGQLFEPFVTTKPNGIGIGLTIVRTIVEAHGGTLAARNNTEGGATFSVTLPVTSAPK